MKHESIKETNIGSFVGVFVGIFALLLFAIPFLPQVSSNSTLFAQLIVTNTLMTIAAIALFVVRARAGIRWSFAIEMKATHVAQAFAQGSIYVYWGYFYFGVRDYAPLIVYQLAFAVLFHFLFSLFRTRGFKVGLSVFPIVASINFFLWFKPEVFFLQIGMVGLAILGKSYLQRNLDGKRTHIFNPSGLVLACAGLVLLAFNLHGLVNTDLAASFALAPHLYLFVFAAGCLSHWAGQVSFVALGAVVSMILVDSVFVWIFGVPPTSTIIHQNNFIGITLLITDPVTSPKTKIGQFWFGSVYGLGNIFTYLTLGGLGAPRFYDKVLIVPFLNYFHPYFDKVSGAALRAWEGRYLRHRLVPVAIYGLAFLSLLGVIERTSHRPGAFFNPSEQRHFLSAQMMELLKNRIRKICQGDPRLPACASSNRQ